MTMERDGYIEFLANRPPDGFICNLPAAFLGPVTKALKITQTPAQIGLPGRHCTLPKPEPGFGSKYFGLWHTTTSRTPLEKLWQQVAKLRLPSRQ